MIILLFCLLLNFAEASVEQKPHQFYENFDDNPAFDPQMKKMIRPYLLPLDHSTKEALDLIFTESRVTRNLEAFVDAGFEILFIRPATYICIARHVLLPGYLLKVYLDDELRQREGHPSWRWLVNRCKGADNIRKLIKKKKLQYFAVPDKWIYPLPLTSNNFPQPVILLVTDMNLAKPYETKWAWKNATKKQLNELFCILSYGYSSTDLLQNIPLSKDGKFVCIDTEHPKRKQKYSRVKSFLSEPMQAYWDKLTSEQVTYLLFRGGFYEKSDGTQAQK